MNRNDFISAIILELENKKSLETLIPSYEPKDVHKKLCYDYPLVSIEELEVLADGLSDGMRGFISVGIVQKTFLDNIVYYSKIGNEKSPFFARICCSLSLRMAKDILFLKASDILGILSNEFDSYRKDTDPLTEVDWDIYVNRFKSLCMLSAINNISDFKFDNHPTAINYLDSLCELIFLLHSQHSHSNEQHENYHINKNTTLLNILHSHDQPNHSNFSQEFLYGTNHKSSRQTLWLHYCFLARDIILEFPNIIPHFLPKFLNSLFHNNNFLQTQNSSRSISIQPDSTSASFPSDVECLFIVIISNLSSSLVNHSYNNQQPNNKSLSHTSHVTALFKVIFPLLCYVTQILERMERFGSTLETVGYTVDLLNLVVENHSVHIRSGHRSTTSAALSLHDTVTSTRILQLLLKMYLEHGSSVTGPNPLSSHSFNPSESNVFIFSNEARRTDLVLSRLILNSPDTGTYLLRYPGWLPALSSTTATPVSCPVVCIPEGDLVAPLEGFSVGSLAGRSLDWLASSFGGLSLQSAATSAITTSSTTDSQMRSTSSYDDKIVSLTISRIPLLFSSLPSSLSPINEKVGNVTAETSPEYLIKYVLCLTYIWLLNFQTRRSNTVQVSVERGDVGPNMELHLSGSGDVEKKVREQNNRKKNYVMICLAEALSTLCQTEYMEYLYRIFETNGQWKSFLVVWCKSVEGVVSASAFQPEPLKPVLTTAVATTATAPVGLVSSGSSGLDGRGVTEGISSVMGVTEKSDGSMEADAVTDETPVSHREEGVVADHGDEGDDTEDIEKEDEEEGSQSRTALRKRLKLFSNMLESLGMSKVD